MKRRILVKVAKQFLDGRRSFPVRYEECITHTDGRPGVDQWWAIMPWKLEKEVRRQAYLRGWSGCHWDNPLIVRYDESRLNEWEEMNPGR